MGKQINYPASLPSKLLDGIFELQRQILTHYISIEGLPPYPLSGLDSKPHQTLMKNFIARGVEELSEAHEIYQQLYLLTNHNHPDANKRVELIKEFVEELSDALHFFVEAMIYSNVDEHAMMDWYTRLLNDEKSALDTQEEDCLKVAMMYASRHIEDFIGSEHLNSAFFTVSYEAVEAEPFLKGGARVSLRMLKDQAMLMWDIAYQFNQGGNCLKNNPWRQSFTETDTDKFQEQMAKGFMALMNLFSYLGLNANDIYTLYFHKNIINQNRIKEKR